MRGAIRDSIAATTPYKVCHAVDDGVTAIHKAMEARCDLILLNLSMPLQDSVVTVSVLRSKLPHVKILGFSASSAELGNQVSPEIGFDVVLTKQDGLSELVTTLEALMSKPPREDHSKFFKALGHRVRKLRRRRGYSQEDMITFGFSARHWQQIEAGRPINMTTLLRICDVFKVRIAAVVRDADEGIYGD